MPGCTPFAQSLCSADTSRASTSSVPLAASWCARSNPFVLPRPLGTPPTAMATSATCERVGTEERASDTCSLLVSVSTAEVHVPCAMASSPPGLQSLLCGGGEAESVALSLKLLGLQNGALMVVDASSGSEVIAPLDVVPGGRALTILEAASFGDAGAARLVNQSASTSSSVAHAAVVLAGDAAALEVYVVHSAGGLRASQCADGSHSLRFGAGELRGVAVGRSAAGAMGSVVAAVLVQERSTAAGEAKHELRVLRLTVTASQCGLPAAIIELGRIRPVLSDAVALPLRVHVLAGAQPARVPWGGSDGDAGTSLGDGLGALRAAIGLGAGVASARIPADDDDAPDCDHFARASLVLVHDARSLHMVGACAAGSLLGIEMRASAVSHAPTLAYEAEPGAQLTAASAFFDRFARPPLTEAGARTMCIPHQAWVLEGCSGAAGCRRHSVDARYCAAATADGAHPSTCPSDRRSLPLLWLAVAQARTPASRASVLRLVPLPELRAHASQGNGNSSSGSVLLPDVRCGVPSEDASFNLNWYWARRMADGHVVCEARRVHEVALAAAAAEVEVRFREVDELLGGEQNALLSSVAEQPCDLLLRVPGLQWAHAVCVDRSPEALDARGPGSLSSHIDVNAMISQSQRLALRGALQHVLYVRLRPSARDEGSRELGSRQTRIELIGVQERLFTPSELVVEPLSSLVAQGEARSMHVSANGLYLWAAVRRERWELASLGRVAELCAAWRETPEDPILSQMGLAAACEGSSGGMVLLDGDNGRRWALGMFGWEWTACPAGALCPSFESERVYPAELIAPGLHTERAYEVARCPAGSFCLGGRKIACLPGYQCPEEGMSAPVRCESLSRDLTCFDERRHSGVVSPLPCGDGRICTVPYAPGMPVPPGYFQRWLNGSDAWDGANRSARTARGVRQVVPCQRGQWCPLGASASSLQLCPAATYCTHPGVLRPTICNFTVAKTTHCPAGSWKEHPCKPGYSCPGPMTMRECSLRSYCPAGSLFESPCPAGRYCPNATVALVCPEGSICAEGSILPQRCGFFEYCPAGSVMVVWSLRAPIMVIFALLLLAAYGRAFRRHRKQERTSAAGGTDAVAHGQGSEVEMVEPCEAVLPTRGMTGYAQQVDDRLRETPHGVDIRFRQLSVRLGSGRTVLHPSSGQLLHGELTAVMGPSGGGKTTLLMGMAGRVQFDGHVYVDGVVARRGVAALLGSRFAHVPQEDVMYRRLTVEENIWMSAALRLSLHARQHGGVGRAVARVVNQMQLSHVQHVAVGDEAIRGVSGGERKRTNIALELVAGPSCIFVDEPTTGLDAATAKQVVYLLHTLTKRERVTMACVVHQPRYEVMALFDSLLLMSRGGRLVYQGPVMEATCVYESLQLQRSPMCSLGDFLLDIVSDPTHDEAMLELWRSRAVRTDAAGIGTTSTESDSYVTSAGTHGIGSSAARQLRLCVLLHLKLRYRDMRVPLLEIIATISYATCTGLLFFQKAYEGPLTSTERALCPDALRNSLCTLPLSHMLEQSYQASAIGLSILLALSSSVLAGSNVSIARRYESWGVSLLAQSLGLMVTQMLEIFIHPILYCAIVKQLWGISTTMMELLYIFFGISLAACGIGHVTINMTHSISSSQLLNMTWIIMLSLFRDGSQFLHNVNLGPLLLLPKVSYIGFAMDAGFILELRYFIGIYDVFSILETRHLSFDFCSIRLMSLYAAGAAYYAFALLLLHLPKVYSMLKPSMVMCSDWPAMTGGGRRRMTA